MKRVLLSHPRGRHPSGIVPVLCIVLISGSGCASAGKLVEHVFCDRTAGVVRRETPGPEILTDEFPDVSSGRGLPSTSC